MSNVTIISEAEAKRKYHHAEEFYITARDAEPNPRTDAQIPKEMNAAIIGFSLVLSTVRADHHWDKLKFYTIRSTKMTSLTLRGKHDPSIIVFAILIKFDDAPEETYLAFCSEEHRDSFMLEGEGTGVLKAKAEGHCEECGCELPGWNSVQ